MLPVKVLLFEEVAVVEVLQNMELPPWKYYHTCQKYSGCLRESRFTDKVEWVGIY